MKKNTNQNNANMKKDIYNNDSMAVANAITAFLSLWNNLEWMKIEYLLYDTVKSVLYKSGLAKSLSTVMRESPSYVVDEVAAYLKRLLLIDDMKKLRHFADKPKGDFTRWAATNARLYAERRYTSEHKRAARFVSDENDVAINTQRTFSVEETFIEREIYQYVTANIDNLPEEQRAALKMKMSKEYGMLSNKDLSRLLGVNENVFNKRIHDARKNLRKMSA